jgi:hypothetical protein
MRHIILTAAFISITLQGLAQQITISPKLRQGDEFRLELIRIRENSSRPQQNGKSRTIVDVRVISAGSQGIVLDWMPGETVIENTQVAQDPLVAAASRAVQDMRFRITLNAEGEFTGLANQAEVMPKLQSAVDVMVQELSSRLPAQQREAFRGVIGQVLSPDALIASATREVEIYFGLNGFTLSGKEAAESTLQVPSPLGGGQISAKFRVQMDSAKPDSASLRTTTTYDAAALQRMTEALAKQSGVAIPPEELARLPRVQMADDGSYLFDRAIGLMREVTIHRRISAANNSRYDGWQIRLLTGPKR